MAPFLSNETHSASRPASYGPLTPLKFAHEFDTESRAVACQPSKCFTCQISHPQHQHMIVYLHDGQILLSLFPFQQELLAVLRTNIPTSL